MMIITKTLYTVINNKITTTVDKMFVLQLLKRNLCRSVDNCTSVQQLCNDVDVSFFRRQM